jgi:hypothetical protein
MMRSGSSTTGDESLHTAEVAKWRKVKSVAREKRGKHDQSFFRDLLSYYL